MFQNLKWPMIMVDFPDHSTMVLIGSWNWAGDYFLLSVYGV